MAINHFIPTVWSETLYKELDKRYVGVANCNREFEGEIKNKGSVVKICGVGSIDINYYSKNSNMSAPQALSDTVHELIINRARYFNFQIDDIDRAQCTPKLMDAAMRIAANGLAAAADQCIYELYRDHPNVIMNENLTPDNLFDTIVAAKELLYHAGVYEGTEVVLEISPSVASILYKAKLILSTDNTTALETGCIGTVAGCKVFVTNAICEQCIDNDISMYKCFMRTKRAIAFAEQLSEIEAYRPEMRFADAVKGLHLYGASIVYPDELVILDLAAARSPSTRN